MCNAGGVLRFARSGSGKEVYGDELGGAMVDCDARASDVENEAAETGALNNGRVRTHADTKFLHTQLISLWDVYLGDEQDGARRGFI